jgi:hypothetical protein
LLGNDCLLCDGTGRIFTLCHHPYEAGSGTTVNGPVENFTNIDTLATQVMSTYHYENVDKINFRYGAKSGALSSNGSGIRLNSTWFREFSLEPAVTLPVKMTSFFATSEKGNVNLAWTANEENFSNYVIQRSTDGKNYSDIAIVFAGNTDQMASYKFKDANVSSSTGMLFYRLQLVDHTKEGAKYSDVRVIRLGKDQESIQLTTYPNPVRDQVRITLPSAWQGKPVMLELFTANGIKVQGMQLSSASQTESMQLGKISNGFYLVKATCENQVAQQRIVKN